jgi:RNA polymerase sigma factor (sigma-70 family)
MTSEAVASKIESLSPRLQRKARVIAHKSDQVDVDDAYQDMVLSILERSEHSPDFVEQTDSYITQQAAWDASHVARSGRIYRKYNAVPVEFTDDEGDTINLIDITPDPTDVEAETLESLEMKSLAAAIKALAPDNRQVVIMLYQGYSNKEIAEKMGISPAAVSQRKGTIRKHLEPFVTGQSQPEAVQMQFSF